MQLTVNGEEKHYAGDSLTMSELLAAQGVEAPEMVAVQVNGSFLQQQEYGTFRLGQGDSVEFLYFMGGGGR